MSAVHNVDLSAEIRGAFKQAVRGIERSAMFALLGERLGALPPDVKLPAAEVTVQLGRGPSGEVSPEQDALLAEMGPEFPTYCNRYAVLAMITSCEEYLQRLLLIARVAAVAAQQQRFTTTEQFHQTHESCRKEVRRTSVDGLVPAILSSVGKESETVVGLEWFRSVYSIKRCLTHRGGRIGPDDVGGQETLDVVWRRPVLKFDGDEVVSLPYETKKEGLVSVGFTDESRSWRLGEAINLTAQECQHVGFSLSIFCKELADLLQRALLDLFGVEPRESSNT